MADDCPSCEKPSLGGTIVKIEAAVGDEVMIGVVCPHCGTVYRSQGAREQLGELIHD